MTMGPAPMIMMDLISVLFGMTAPIRQNFAGYSRGKRGRKRIPSAALYAPEGLAQPSGPPAGYLGTYERGVKCKKRAEGFPPALILALWFDQPFSPTARSAAAMAALRAAMRSPVGGPLKRRFSTNTQRISAKARKPATT